MPAKDKLHIKRHRRAVRARFSWLKPPGSAQLKVIDTPIQTLFSLAKYKPVRKYTHKHVCHPRRARAGTTYISPSLTRCSIHLQYSPFILSSLVISASLYLASVRMYPSTTCHRGISLLMLILRYFFLNLDISV